jgi:type II secretory pathway component PulK
MEYLMVVAFVFVMIMPFLVYFLTESNNTTNEISNAQLSQIARKIVENAEKVYAFGEPTTLTLQVYMPANVQSAEISGTELTFIIADRGSLSSVVEMFPMNVSGNISTGEGIHRIRLRAVESSVEISEIT